MLLIQKKLLYQLESEQRKIDVKNRQSYPVVVDKNGRVLWLPGLKKSKYDKSKTGKYDIILKYYKEEHNDTK